MNLYEGLKDFQTFGAALIALAAAGLAFRGQIMTAKTNAAIANTNIANAKELASQQQKDADRKQSESIKLDRLAFNVLFSSSIYYMTFYVNSIKSDADLIQSMIKTDSEPLGLSSDDFTKHFWDMISETKPLRELYPLLKTPLSDMKNASMEIQKQFHDLALSANYLDDSIIELVKYGKKYGEIKKHQLSHIMIASGNLAHNLKIAKSEVNKELTELNMISFQ